MAIEPKRLRTLIRAISDGGGPEVAVAPTSPVAGLLDRFGRIARSHAPVLLWGEPGVGKTTLLQGLHALRGPGSGPLVRLRPRLQTDAHALVSLFGEDRRVPPGTGRSGAVHEARGGMLLIDGIEDLCVRAQAWLYEDLTTRARLAEAGGTDPTTALPRVVATARLDPRQAVEDGDLREDLYYLLAVVQAEVPPLRRRRSDVLAWAQCFLDGARHRFGLTVQGFTDQAVQALVRHPWLGNGPELRNAVERAAVMSDGGLIGVGELPTPDEVPPAVDVPRIVVPVGTTVDDAERRLILATLEHTGFNKAEAARTLALDVKTVRNKLKAYGVS